MTYIKQEWVDGSTVINKERMDHIEDGIYQISVQPGVPGEAGKDGVTPQFRVQDGYIQVSTDNGGSFSNLVSLEAITGPQGAPGNPFAIYKTYASIEEMNADAENIPLNAFVLISSTEENVDNGKLYVKGADGLTFLTDLSGAQGIQGEPGKDGVTPQLSFTVQTLEPGSECTVQQTGTAEAPQINLGIPRGATGENGVTPLFRKGETAIEVSTNNGSSYEPLVSLADLTPTIPEKLLNPYALTIKYNGMEAFTYDGSQAETGNFVVNGTTVPIDAQDDAQSVKKYIDTAVDATQAGVSGSEADIVALKQQLQILQEQVQQLKTPVVQTVDFSAEAPTISQPEENVAFNGTISNLTATVEAKSVQATDAKIESGRLAATATDDVSFGNLQTSGNLPKSTANAGVSINNNGYVTITGGEWAQTGYNGFEVGLNAENASKAIFIDGMNFTAKMDNNAVSIFGWQENAQITISNCHFADVSNPIRLSNRGNVPATINIVNCTCDKWDSNAQYAGFVLMQDYTSSTAEEAQTANRFSNITLNFVNCTGPNGRIVGDRNALGTEHIVYVYTDKEGLIDFATSPDRYPATMSAK